MSRRNLYIGKSGQMAVMAEYLARGYNVAIPEVDIGDDIFVVRDEIGEFSRIQVKSATARNRTGGFTAQFSVLFRQLETPLIPDLYYVFTARRNERWEEFLILGRRELYDHHINNNVGTRTKQSVIVRLSFSNVDVICQKQSFQVYRNNWSNWPTVEH